MLYLLRKENSGCRFSRAVFIAGILLSALTGTYGQMYSETDSRPLIIRSGLKGAVGYSALHISDAVRPFFTTSDYYSFKPDLCLKAGAIVVVQPGFFGERFELVFDPAFTKFSYGNYKEIESGNYISAVDIDVESLEFPISLRYSFLRGIHTIRPFIRGGYSYSFFIDTEAYFESKDWSGDELVEYETTKFEYSTYQDILSFSLGVEFDLNFVDYTLELVVEKGDGIHEDKFGDSFLKITNTTSAYMQVGVLF